MVTKREETPEEFEARYQDTLKKYNVTKREETPEEFEARYQAMLKKYNIKPDNIELDKGGAASYYEDVKDDSRPAREERDMKSYKEYERKRTKEDETRKSVAVSKMNKSKVEKKKSGSPQSTRRDQTSKGGSTVPPKKGYPKEGGSKVPPKKGYPKGGYKEENQDVEGINGNAVKTMLYNDRVKLKSRNGRPAKKFFKPAETTLASIRSEYQKDLIAKHKKEVADIREGKVVKSTNKKKVATKPTFKTNSLSIANLRNEYQQELIKKRKKEMQK